ncbi:MAG: alpha-glucan family phosphorylase [Deltaproteobacteria bacterium]|nr:alpha-glucan family phosphorylase [Deltaproteobacteria bacterium]
MRPSLTFQIKPDLPEPLAPLAEIASNLWFCWHAEAVDLLQRLDHHLWREVSHNPVALLNQVSQERLETLATDSGFLAQMERVAEMMRAYLDTTKCAFLNGRAPEGLKIAYFSAEYGLTDCLSLYSGGLGVLSGDHLKSASDLNLPLVAVGLAYGQGYFNQYLNADGWQQEEYHPNDFYNLPMSLVTGEDGKELRISVDIEGRPLQARVWQISVGRVPLYLMDSNLDDNPADLRSTTYQLYGGDRQMRIRQEILLGIGGVRLLKALGIEANVFHMNEGHSAFASLERIRQLRQEKGLNFNEAREVVRASNCFTTHTPVPAGNDYFDPELVRRHFAGYVAELGISLPVLMGFGRVDPRNDSEQFCMTVLALRLSGFSNGVSRLHGQVSRQMWQGVWPHFPVEDLPIGHVTNGVHIPSWISNDMAYLYYRYLGPGWHEDPDSQTVWKAIEEVPDAELWRVRERRRSQMVAFIRGTMVEQLSRRGASAEELRRAGEALNPEALTIVFARRFATYKRAVLIAQDLERLDKILGDPKRPVQLIFAGKAHPKDNEGKEFIRRVVALTHDKRFRDKIVFIEDYDINTARYLVQGADIWLNTPRRPMEACGTSGMKAVANGGLHLSILDGWWDEGFQPGVGWAIGRGEEHPGEYPQDEVEARALYRLLEDEVVPLFYRRDAYSLPRGWIAYIKNSLRNLCPMFNSHRQVEDYAEQGYIVASQRYQNLVDNECSGAKELGAWAQRIMENWGQVQVVQTQSSAPPSMTWGQDLPISALVRLGGLQPADVAVDAYYGRLRPDGEFAERLTHTLEPVGENDGAWRFGGKVKVESTGRLGLVVRVVPYHPLAGNKYSLGLAAWG